MNLAYFDCFSGASGDMILGALLDTGLNFETLQSELWKLGLKEYELNAEPVKRNGIGGTQFQVKLLEEDSAHRHLHHVTQIIESSGLTGRVKEQSIRIFTRLAEAEARVHRTTVEKVHFHEVGAVDAIVDIVGAAIGLEQLGVDQILCSELVTGSGFVECQHGRMPVPAPATAELIKNVPNRTGIVEKELLTPTGAAILTTLSDSFGPKPSFAAESIGYGAGSRELEQQPNLLRVFVGETAAAAESDQVWVVETNLDDISAQAVGYVSEQLLKAGALDVFSVPIQMKKSRPGVLLSVIAAPENLIVVEQLLLKETTTFGVRRYAVERKKLEREIIKVATTEGEVRVKLGRLGGKLVKASPEYEDCRRLAEASGQPFQRVYETAARKAAEIMNGEMS